MAYGLAWRLNVKVIFSIEKFHLINQEFPYNNFNFNLKEKNIFTSTQEIKTMPSQITSDKLNAEKSNSTETQDLSNETLSFDYSFEKIYLVVSVTQLPVTYKQFYFKNVLNLNKLDYLDIYYC